MKSTKRNIAILIILALLLIITIAISLSEGSTGSGFKKLYETFILNQHSGYKKILFKVRIPRLIVALVVGMNLSISGALLQAVMRNPLADPGVIGVSAGASLAAIATMFIFPQFLPLLPAFAFLGGVIAFVIVYIFAWKNGIRPLRVILAGVAINGALGGMTNGIGLLNTEKIPSLMLWTSGDISTKSWDDVTVIIAVTVIAIISAFLVIRNCNVLLLGDEMALNLGVEPNKNRILISVIAVALAAISTAYVGIIAFVGLIIPHICRLILGSDYKFLIPGSLLLGGLFILGADTFTRIVFATRPIPVGILMSIVGGPFFLYLLRRSRI
ncbi:MAG: iron ABC transporter permease [Andreesenia angusta]|nr:iron ABC transporter permease [Andreesenia angusta]